MCLDIFWKNVWIFIQIVIDSFDIGDRFCRHYRVLSNTVVKYIVVKYIVVKDTIKHRARSPARSTCGVGARVEGVPGSRESMRRAHGVIIGRIWVKNGVESLSE